MNPTVDQNPDSKCSAAGRGWRTAALLLAAVLVVLVCILGGMFGAGWRFQRLKPAATGPAVASAEKWSPPIPKEDAASRVKRVARDLAAVSFAPTNQPDPGKVLDDARTLAAKGQYEEALQRHIWYHNHALEYNPGQSGVRMSFALSSWIELGRKYPKARQALVEIRDRGNQRFAEGRGDFALFQEVSSINQSLQAEDDTVALFKSILKQDAALARQCYYAAEDLLVRKGEYETCMTFIPDFEAKFSSIVEQKENLAKLYQRNPQMAAQLQKFHDGRFVQQVRDVIEILVAAGRKPEAEKIRDQAVAILDSPRIASAVADAEKKLAK